MGRILDCLLCRHLSRDYTILRIFIISGLISFAILVGGIVWAFTTIDYAKSIQCKVVERSVTRSTFSKCTDTINYEYHYKVSFGIKTGGLLQFYNTTACYGGTPCYYSYGPSCSAESCPLPVKCKQEIQTKIDDYVRTPVGTYMKCYYHDSDPFFLQYGDVVPFDFHYPTLGLVIPGFLFSVVFLLAWRTKRQDIKLKEEELPLSSDAMVDGYQQDPSLGSPFGDNRSLAFSALSPPPSSRAMAGANGSSDDYNDGMGMGGSVTQADPRLTPPAHAHRRSIADDDIDDTLDGGGDDDNDNDDNEAPRRSAVAGVF